MKTTCILLVLATVATPVMAAEQATPLHDAIQTAAASVAQAQQHDSGSGHGALFWSGLAVGVAGVTTAVLGTTVYRTEDSSAGNSPQDTYRQCVAQKSDPVYATNDCNGLKAKNMKMLWSGVAVGVAGAAMMIGGSNTSAEVAPGAIRFVHRWRF